MIFQLPKNISYISYITIYIILLCQQTTLHFYFTRLRMFSLSAYLGNANSQNDQNESPNQEHTESQNAENILLNLTLSIHSYMTSLASEPVKDRDGKNIISMGERGLDRERVQT